jgi:hypothetical protein
MGSCEQLPIRGSSMIVERVEKLAHLFAVTKKAGPVARHVRQYMHLIHIL